MSAQQSLQETEEITGETNRGIEPFTNTLSKHGLRLIREQTHTLQVNVGLLCNQACRHCHLSAGPDRKENMDQKTADDVIGYAARAKFETIDITGGAPELNPHLTYLVEGLAPLANRLMLRSNLSALNDGKRDHLMQMLKDHKVVIVASFPSFNETQTDSQRGQGIFQVSVSALKKLNQFGYGREDGDLELNLISNPAGAFLPPSQAETEKRFRQVLKKKWGILFNHLFNFANVPLGRFGQWLVRSGNMDAYMGRLISNFNPCAAEGVMCRSLVSVAWDGVLYDCDFNIAKGLTLGGRQTHISEMDGPPDPGSLIGVADHCYACTAGAGFT